MTVEEKLKTLGITLKSAPAPAANYVPFTQSGNLVFVSGQISAGADGPITGKLGDTFSIEDGQAAARICALNLLAQLKTACGGDLNRVKRVVRLGGFVNAAPDFNDHPAVINGASDLMVAVFGDAGRHARAAVGCSSLPFGVAVEVEGVFEVT
ncbi:MAG: RidA family protein [Pseudomonadota bacterium]